MKYLTGIILTNIIFVLFLIWIFFPNLLVGYSTYIYFWFLFISLIIIWCLKISTRNLFYIAFIITIAGAILNIIFPTTAGETTLRIGMIYWLISSFSLINDYKKKP